MFKNIYTACGIRITRFVFSLIIFFGNNVFCFSFEMKDNPDTLTFTEHNNGDTVHVARGTVLVFKLEAVPGTGYAWYAEPVKSQYLIMIEEPMFFPKEADSNNTAIGSVSYQVFRFSAYKAGTEILTLSYMRIWEKNKPPLKTFSITVSIKQ